MKCLVKAHFNSLIKACIHFPHDFKVSYNEYLGTYNLVTHVLEPWALKQPNHNALIFTDGKVTETMTYSELLTQADQLASSLSHRGLPAPKCAIVILPKIKPWWVINTAASLTETIISPGSLMLSEKDILYRLKMCEADAIFCDISTMRKIERSTKHIPWRILTDETEEEEIKALPKDWVSYHSILDEGKGMKPIRKKFNGHSIAQLFFTSGTTGHPKMVPHTQVGEWLNLQPEDIMWNVSDLGWAKSAYSNLFAPLLSGSTSFIHKMPKFDSKTVLKTLEEIPISVICLPPTAYRAIVQEDLSKFKPKNLKRCASAGEPLTEEVQNFWKEKTGIWIQEGYGQSEGTISCFTSPGMKVKPGFIGKPTYGFDLKILDSDLKELGPNEVGQIAYDLKRSWPYGLFKGYYKNEELNNKVFVKGYFLTGDNAFIDEEGYVYCVGRNDDIIKTAGYKVGPFEVESALIEHPAVIESAVVGSPDKERGHVIKAFVVLREDYKESIKTEEGYSALVKELKDFVKNIEFVDDLPKTNSDKY
ncbi:Acyl-coenzyme A synthetase ACSM3, mitochondrial [Armadillidium nasatum]|uniref:medium-chain acyl-CoA ligase n=1 Tax=Armadillidium nasatum TaxID=96803 RepID=A0A5N5SVA4_9CRUS|nr:Acyl-coenzyme A synthetase ACSM3, mitochondrial [Armadillidium nasatum]